MVKHTCGICGKTFKQKSHFTQHQARKSPCKSPAALLTNLNNEMDYAKLKKTLPYNVMPAYDGLTLSI